MVTIVYTHSLGLLNLEQGDPGMTSHPFLASLAFLQTRTMFLLGIGFVSIVAGCNSSSQEAAPILNLALQGDAMAGAVVSQPGGIDCGATCSSSFALGTSVQLNATAIDPYEFAGWGGDCAGRSPVCQLGMDGNKNVTAAFRKPSVNLQLTLSGQGGGAVTSMPAGVNCTAGACAASFGKNTSVTLTAAADGTSVFTGWGGACTGSQNTCTLDLFSDAQVTAMFGKAPSSCEQIRADDPTTADGNQTLFINGDSTKPWTAFCLMSVMPAQSYLNLTNVGANQNFSQYTAGGGSPGTSVKTNYTRVRIDPMTLKIDTNDQTFATTTGGPLKHSGSTPVTSMPYATAMDCTAGSTGLANIDLTGTQFAIAAGALALDGANFSGMTTPTPNGQVRAVAMTGGGFCGWNAPPGSSNPFNQFGSPLNLVYFP